MNVCIYVCMCVCMYVCVCICYQDTKNSRLQGRGETQTQCMREMCEREGWYPIIYVWGRVRAMAYERLLFFICTADSKPSNA